MTDAVVGFVLEKLESLLVHEANLFRRVKGDVNLLRDDLGIMNAFLKDSEGKGDDHYMVKVLINQIRDTAYEAEDVTNTYMAQVIKQRRRKLLMKLFHWFDHAFALHAVAEKTQSVKKRIENIYANKTTFGIEAQSHVDEEAEQSLQQRRRNVEEEDVVGFIDDTAKLVDQLTNEQRLHREVISIIGMGGLGKTTLARKIYNDARIKNRFDHCAWVNVSQEYKTSVLLLDILKCFVKLSDEMYKMSNEELKVMLRDNLKGKRYFVVMDDVWKPRFWDEIRACFPDDLNGSRILITSREKEVASHASSTPPYFLPFLDKERSWELLCKKVFRGEKCPSNLERLGRQLAKKCKGLPLSIVVLGGILANKEKTQQTWSNLIGNVNWFLIDDDNKRCSDILALSYSYLPRKLRVCFLYVGVFPEDFLIPARTLIQMWVAEGFISVENDSKKMDEIDVAEYYLEQLIDRSLILVASRRSDGGVKTCRIHDLVRDYCIKMSIQEKFYEVRVNSADLRRSSNSSIPRRLSIQGNIDSESISSSRTSNNSISVGSLLLFNSYFHYNPLNWALKNFRFVRLLSVEVGKSSDYFFTFSKEIGQLVFLRYLRISFWGPIVTVGSWKSFPAYICKLPYLETIHLKGGAAMPMPNEIWMMKQLRHLYASGGIELEPPSKVGHTLSNLKVLSFVRVDGKTSILFRKSLFPNLRKLHLGIYSPHVIDTSTTSEILASLESLQNLQIFKLSDLKVGRRLDLFPSSSSESSSKLTKITFVKCEFLDPNHLMGILGKLANLQILKIKNCDMSSRQLHFMAGEFPQLEVFEMIGVGDIATWELETHAMPNLQHLFIRGCDDLRNLPDELWSLANLRMVEVSAIQPDLREKLMIKQSKLKKEGYSCKLILRPGYYSPPWPCSPPRYF
ncbi:disease resistance protein RPP13 [Ziziphus jujuba]|uniref:Disease resistance protein RPP13 n=1 Tax=Ziziphus jujuba TaxID=326968 RepID=A0ABM4A3M5_ZIZJJ|nr:disease resistance protein RPP13 [Ziziphus jujuba]